VHIGAVSHAGCAPNTHKLYYSTVPHPDQRKRALHGLIPRCRKRSRRLCARSVGLTLMSRCKSSHADRRSASGMVRANRSKSGAESFDLLAMEAAHAQGE